MKLIMKPAAGTYDTYMDRYITLVPDDGMLLQHLYNNRKMIDKRLSSLTPEQWMHRYAEGKWSVKEVVLHLCDTERILSYRVLRMGRGDATPLSGFDQDPYIPASHADSRTPESLLEEYAAVRHATLTLLGHLPEAAWDFSGTANGHPSTARAVAYMIAGHDLHHFRIIEERYLA